MYGKNCQVSPLAFPVFFIRDPSIQVSPAILVGKIYVGADNFHVSLGDVVHHVDRLVEYNMGGVV